MDSQEALGALAALAHETRLEVFRVLVRAGRVGMAAGALAEQLEIPSATLSFHLKELKNSGIVGCRREGRSLIYSPNFDSVTELLEFLTRNCCEGESDPCIELPENLARS